MRNELDKYVDIVMSIDGQISRAEARTLIELARDTNPGSVIVEIGTFRGRSTAALAFGSKLGNQNRIYAIDPHVMFTGVFGGEFGPKDQAELYQNLVKAGVGHIVAVVSLPSQAAARCWDRKNVGLLWIDGDHSYEAVSADYKSWSRFLVKDGLIAFHDQLAPGVAQLLGELLDKGSLTPGGKVEALSWFKLAAD